MTEADNIKTFLSGTRREILSVSGIEKLASLPRNTLTAFLLGQRGLPDVHIQNVVRVLVLVGYEPVTDRTERVA